MAPSDRKAKKDKWSKEQTLALSDFLNKYINENGQNVLFKWSSFNQNLQHMLTKGSLVKSIKEQARQNEERP